MPRADADRPGVGEIRADLCVIGGGSGGLSVAAGAAQMGADTVLIERGAMGGDCLNTGCVPSKALIAAAAVAQAQRHAGRFGIAPVEPSVDYAAVMDHVRDVIAGIAPHDSAERFQSLGVRVISGAARFTGPDTVGVGDLRIRARRFVVATGARAAVPAIPGLADVPYFTNETLWTSRERPAHLIVIGGGPVGLELGQAHRRLGSAVTVLERDRLLPQDDPELVGILRRRLAEEGVVLHEGLEISHVERTDGGLSVVLESGERIAGTHLLVAAGRHPEVESLGLEAAGIAFGPQGIETDARQRTTNRRVYAVGDVAGQPQSTHAAAYQAGIVLRNALFRLPAKATAAMPRVTYTDPELAQVGLTEAEARSRYGDVRVLRWSFADNDRARTQRDTDGLAKIVATRRGRILGAGIAGPHAGEAIQPVLLAMAQGLRVGALAQLVVPYPTIGEATKRAAGSFYTDRLFGAGTRRLVRWLRLFA